MASASDGVRAADEDHRKENGYAKTDGEARTQTFMENLRYLNRRRKTTLRWSIDCADARALSRARREILEELRHANSDAARLFDVEIVLGEMLAAQVERGHIALAVALERRGRSPAIHIYSQGKPLESVPEDPIRDAILRATRVPMSIESSDQGAHICLRLLLGHEQPLRRLKLRLETSKFSLNF